MRILLRLLGVADSYARQGLELALEAVDDSDAEFERVRALYLLPTAQREAQLGVGAATIANAKKIFPSWRARGPR